MWTLLLFLSTSFPSYPVVVLDGFFTQEICQQQALAIIEHLPKTWHWKPAQYICVKQGLAVVGIDEGPAILSGREPR